MTIINYLISILFQRLSDTASCLLACRPCALHSNIMKII